MNDVLLLGYCLTCHRMRYIVRTLVLPENGVPKGVCTQCDREEREQREKEGNA